MTDAIDRFDGENKVLSNFGGTLPITSEHLYQAMKSTDWEEQLYVLAAPSPRAAKYRGSKVTLREDWDDIKEEVMWCVIQAKFAPGTAFAKFLLETGDAELIEGNWWGDEFWGFDFKKEAGANVLGKLLMAWRDELREIDQT